VIQFPVQLIRDINESFPKFDSQLMKKRIIDKFTDDVTYWFGQFNVPVEKTKTIDDEPSGSIIHYVKSFK
jgi:hypothetical protein